MAESENTKEVVNQLAVQAAMVVMTVLRDTEAGSQLTTMMSHREPQRHKHSGPVLVKPLFNCYMQDRYIELMNFEMEVLNFLETKAYGLFEEENVPVIKNCLSMESLQLIQTFTQEVKEKCRTTKGLLTVLCS